MIALLLALQVPPAPPAALPPVSRTTVTPGPIGRQVLPARGCAAFLWSRAPTPEMVAMVTADPPAIRLALDGRTADYQRVAAEGGEAGLGFAARAEYRAGDVVATLDLALVEQRGLADGAAVRDATLSIARTGADTTVVPLGGLVGCRPAQ